MRFSVDRSQILYYTELSVVNRFTIGDLDKGGRLVDRRKIILDCDPGQDDAIAILLAGRHPRLELLGITVVAGNQTLDKTLKNALHVTQHLGLEVPVYAGASRPLVRETQATAGEIHGESGLDGPVFAPLVKKAEEQHGVWYLIETLMASQGDITLVSCGPMTNIALAMRLEPKITSKIKELVFMGGAYGLGNVTPAAEFNFYCDPESARIVLNSGCPMTMMGLDLTAQALCTREIVQRMKKAKNKAAELFCDTMSFYLEREGLAEITLVPLKRGKILPQAIRDAGGPSS